MRPDILGRLLRGLTFVAAGLTGGDMRALAEEIVDIPEPKLERVVTESETGVDPALRAGRLLRSLAGERGARVGGGVVRSVRLLLERMGPFDRSALIAEWAADPEEGVRMAVAQVLAQGVSALSAPLAIDHLRRDRSPAIRTLALRAAG